MSRAIARQVAVTFVFLLALVPPAFTQDKEEEHAALMRDGDAAMSKRQFEDAIKAYKKANALKQKSSAPALAGLGRAYYAMGALKSALDSWTDALRYVGDDPKLQAQLHNERGKALFGLADKPSDKKVKEAEAEFRQALQLDPALAVGHFNLGVALMRQSRDDEGAAELKAFLAVPWKGPETQRAKDFLANPRRTRENFAPEFSIVTFDQQHIALEDLRGKVVLLDFWASWCGPCKAAVPGLRRLQKRFAERPFTIISVSLDRAEPEARDYVQKNQMTWPQYFDKTRKIAGMFGIEPIPTYVLLDGEGLVVERQEGWEPSYDGYLEKKIEKLLKKIEGQQ